MGLRIGGGIGPLRGSVGRGGARIGVGGSVGPVSASKSVRVGGTKKGAQRKAAPAPKPAPPPSKGELAFGAASLLMDRREKRRKKREKEQARREVAAAKQRRDEEKWARTVERSRANTARTQAGVDSEPEATPGAEFAALASVSGVSQAARASSRVLGDVLMKCAVAVVIYGAAFAVLITILCVLFPPVRLFLLGLFVD